MSKLGTAESKALDHDLNRLAELEDSAKEYAAIEKRLKEDFKERGEGSYAGKVWGVTVEAKPRRDFKVPQEVKEKYAVESQAVYVTWKKL